MAKTPITKIPSDYRINLDRLPPRVRGNPLRLVMLILFFGAMIVLFGFVIVTYLNAQQPPPVPSESPITALPTRTRFPTSTATSTPTHTLDNWSATIFLGIAIAIAIALLTFIGNQILKAFKGAS